MYDGDGWNTAWSCEELILALAGVAQWIECWPVNQKVVDLIPSQGTSLGCGPGPQQEVHEKQTYIDIFLPLFLPPFPSV